MTDGAVDEEVKIKKRKYQPIWEEAVTRAIAGNLHPVAVHIPNLTDEIFKRIRKAYWKERDLDEVNKSSWWCHVERGMKVTHTADIIYFSAVPPTPPWKDRI